MLASAVEKRLPRQNFGITHKNLLWNGFNALIDSKGMMIRPFNYSEKFKIFFRNHFLDQKIN